MRVFRGTTTGDLAVPAILSMALLLVAAGCTGKPSGPADSPVVPVQQPLPATVGSMLGSYSGSIVAIQQVSLAPRVSGQIVALHADVGSEVKAGDALAALDGGVLQAQLFQAQTALQSAQARLGQMLAGPRSADLAAASSALDAAQTKLTLMLQPSLADLAAADSALVAAQASAQNAESAVANARATLLGHIFTACSTFNSYGVPCNAIELPFTPDVVNAISSSLTSRGGAPDVTIGARTIAMLNANESLKSALTSVTVTEASLRAARAKRDTVRNPPPAELAAQRSAVELARANLESKQQPNTEADVQAARAGVAQAQALLAVARANVDQTVITAPFDGVVAQRLLSIGAVATPQTPVFVIVGRAVEVRLAVEDLIASRIHRGDQVDVTVSAFSGKAFKGEVSIVSPIGDVRTHLVDVHVVVRDPEAKLRSGMAAQVGLMVAP